MGEPDPYVFRVSEESEWNAARAAGQLEGGDLDRDSGFIHLSTLSQVAGVLERFYKGRDDLFLLKIDAAKLGDGLKYEAADQPGELFPHFYGPEGDFAPLDINAVVEDQKLTLGENGRHVFQA